MKYRHDDVTLSFQKFIEGHSTETVTRDIEEMVRTVLQGVREHD